MKTKYILSILLLLFASPWLIAQNASELQPTAKKALLHVNLTDFSGEPKANEVLIFTSQNSGKSIQRKSDEKGQLVILLPKGDTYAIKYRSLLSDKQSSSVEIPDEDGIMEATLEVQIESVKNETFELDVHFETGNAKIQASSYPVLDELVAAMKRLNVTKIELSGHTDSDGDAAFNLQLSKDRANAVKDYLFSKGIAEKSIQTIGYGESRPIADNGTEAGKAKNRRTEVRVIETK